MGNCLDGYSKGNGKNKYIKYTNEDVYKGELRNYSREGKGICVYADGKIYEGDWKNDKPHGFGYVIGIDGKRHRGIWFEGVQCKLGLDGSLSYA